MNRVRILDQVTGEVLMVGIEPRTIQTPEQIALHRLLQTAMDEPAVPYSSAEPVDHIDALLMEAPYWLANARQFVENRQRELLSRYLSEEREEDTDRSKLVAVLASHP